MNALSFFQPSIYTLQWSRIQNLQEPKNKKGGYESSFRPPTMKHLMANKAEEREIKHAVFLFVACVHNPCSLSSRSLDEKLSTLCGKTWSRLWSSTPRPSMRAGVPLSLNKISESPDSKSCSHRQNTVLLNAEECALTLCIIYQYGQSHSCTQVWRSCGAGHKCRVLRKQCRFEAAFCF